MKMWMICVVLAILFVAALTSCDTQLSAGDTFGAKVVYLKCEMLYNNDVGDEWTCSLSAGKNTIALGGDWSFEGITEIRLLFTVEEADSTESDYGYEEVIFYADDVTSRWKAYEAMVTVVENDGFFAGHTATWRFEYQVRKE